MEPTDRSIPPVRITNSWPIARMPKIETWRARLARLLPVRKSLLTSVSPPMATSNTTSAPLSRPAMSPRVRTRLLGPAGTATLGGAAPEALASPLGAASSSRLLVMTVVSIGSRQMSLGIGDRLLFDVLPDDGVEVGIVY